jgi:hypothetical protein
MPEFPLLKVKVDKWNGTEVVLVVVTEYFTILFYEYFLKYKIRSSNQETMYFQKYKKDNSIIVVRRTRRYFLYFLKHLGWGVRIFVTEF